VIYSFFIKENFVKLITTSATLLVCLTMLSISHQAAAQAKKAAPASATKAATAKNAAVAAKPTELAMVSADDGVLPNVHESTAKEYKCEYNDTLTIYSTQGDDDRAAIRWKGKVYGLTRVATTTGADRFENKKAGLVWIGIPAKAMLFDSIRGEQLTNDCISY
jgi:hypothetical protein